MKIYQLSHRGVGVVEGEHGGYTYVSSKREAARLRAERASSDVPVEEIRVIKVAISKRGILSALNLYGGHPDNG